MKLAVPVLFLAFAAAVHADTITTPNYTLIIPDGSTVTSVFITPQGDNPFTDYGVDFSFSDGTGEANGWPIDGTEEEINFTTPVTNLSLVVLFSGASFEQLSVPGAFLFSCTYIYTSPTSCPSGTFDFTINGPVSELGFISDQTIGGIESMNFTVESAQPVTTPEPSSFSLLALGMLSAAFAFMRNKIVKDSDKRLKQYG